MCVKMVSNQNEANKHQVIHQKHCQTPNLAIIFNHHDFCSKEEKKTMQHDTNEEANQKVGNRKIKGENGKSKRIIK